jgi:hypothetical protein
MQHPLQLSELHDVPWHLPLTHVPEHVPHAPPSEPQLEAVFPAKHVKSKPQHPVGQLPKPHATPFVQRPPDLGPDGEHAPFVQRVHASPAAPH